MVRSTQKRTKALPRIWGFLVGHGFTPGGMNTRINPPYYKTGNRALAEACRRAKGTTELTPIQMEQYELAQAALNPALMRQRLEAAVHADESVRSEAQAKAEHEAAKARTAAQAAEQRAAEALARVAVLEAAKAANEETKTGEPAKENDGSSDLFGDGESEDASGGLTLADLDSMDVEELAGVLEIYSIPAPSPATRAVFLRITQEAVKGNIRKDPAPEGDDGNKGDSSK